jgi:galactokinase
VARAFDAVYDLRLFPHELMDIAYRGERLTGSQCGRMDQACIYGKTPVLLVFEKEKQVRIEPVFTGASVNMFFVDLAAKKDTVKILSDLQNSYSKSSELQRALGEENERIVRLAYQAMLKGDAAELGALMNEAQQTFDKLVAPHSPDELKSPLLHELLNFKAIKEHVYGGKGVGSQGDGTAQFVARSENDRKEAMARIKRAFPQMRCFPLTIPQGTFVNA